MKESPTLRDIYKAGKQYYDDLKQTHKRIGYFVDLEISEKSFTDYRLKLSLQNIYRDIISPINIQDSDIHLLENILPFIYGQNPSVLGNYALGLKDILYKGMSTETGIGENSYHSGIYFGKIYIPELGKQIIVELNDAQLKKGTYTFSGISTEYPIIDGCWVSQPLIHKPVFEYPFKTLYLLYKFIDFYSKNSNKVILYKNGLSGLFASADLRKMDALKKELQQQAHEVLEKDLLVLDEKDRFEIPNMKLDQADKIMDFVYTELSNMLLVPQSKIRGLAPQGMNATGEYDDLNYEKTLEGFRENYLFPVLDALHIDYTVSKYNEQTKLKMLQDYASNFEKIEQAGIGEIYKKQLFTTLGLNSF